MLAYLEQGSVLYVLAALWLIGVIGKLAVNHVYRGLIRQSDNLATAKDKQLQQMKTKYESIYRIGNGVKDSKSFVCKKMRQYRLMKIRLQSLENCDLHLGIVAITVSLAAAFGTYWWDGSLKMSLLYLATAVVGVPVLLLIRNLTDSRGSREALQISLTHYFNNVLIVRGPRMVTAEEAHEEPVRTRGSMKDDIFMKKPAKSAAAEDKEYGSQETAVSRSKNNQRAEMEALKESLSQIAAARNDGGEKRARRLTPKEEQLIDEILKQYLS